MQEFVFTIEYEHGVDSIMDVFIEYPKMIAKSATCVVTKNSMWRLDRITGPADALSTLDNVFLDPTYCNECLNSERCSKDHQYNMLSRDSGKRIIYSYESNGENCPSVPHIAVKHLGDGLLFETTRQKNQYAWRILMFDNADVRELFETIQAELFDEVQLSLNRLREPMQWGEEPTAAVDLPHEQREAIEAAVKHGYYETPRAITAADLSEKLDIPHSTLQYRLQRAEARFANQFISESL